MTLDEAVKYLPKVKKFLEDELVFHSGDEEMELQTHAAILTVDTLIEFHTVPRPMSVMRRLRVLP